MMGDSKSQNGLFYNLSLETFVPADHPLRRIRPLIDEQAVRRTCRDLYSKVGRPSIPPEQLFLAMVGGYLLGVTSDRKLVMELQCNMALRWFVGLNLDQDAWDASTFSQNRRRRFDRAGVLEKLFEREIEPHVAVEHRGSSLAHQRVRMRRRGIGYRLSQRCRKLIEEFFGEGKELHGLRRFRRRGRMKVVQESFLIGWVLNLKRLAKLLVPAPAAT